MALTEALPHGCAVVVSTIWSYSCALVSETQNPGARALVSELEVQGVSVATPQVGIGDSDSRNMTHGLCV